MEISDNLIHSRSVPEGQSGELIQFSRQAVSWDWMSFSVRRLTPGESWECHHAGEETACVLLSGTCTLEWNKQQKDIGKRRTVFDGLPYALYLAPGDRARFIAIGTCEIAECHGQAGEIFNVQTNDNSNSGAQCFAELCSGDRGTSPGFLGLFRISDQSRLHFQFRKICGMAV